MLILLVEGDFRGFLGGLPYIWVGCGWVIGGSVRFLLSTGLLWPGNSPLTESLTGFIVSTLTISDGSGQKKGAAKGAAPNKFHHWEVEEVRIKLDAQLHPSEMMNT